MNHFGEVTFAVFMPRHQLKIALIREEKNPPDNRVAFSPEQCLWLVNKYPELDIVVQPSAHRCFTDDEYRNEGITVTENISESDLFMGIKEVPPQNLLPGKKYLFFSHTIKKQPQNRILLTQVLKKNVTLIDYECLIWENGERVLGFGHFAGVVGAHNGFYTYGKRYKLFDLKRACQCRDYEELLRLYHSVKLPPVKIAVTGTGRVAKGVYELLEKINLRMVSLQSYLTREFSEPVYVVLNTSQLYERKDGKPFNRERFHQHPEEFISAFQHVSTQTDILMNAIFWNPAAPSFFTIDDIQRPDFRIKVIADISCDINGSIPATIRDTTIEDPIFGFNRYTGREEVPHQTHGIDIMAVSNLPNELPRESSTEFGDKLIEYVVEELLQRRSDIIDRATIAKDGSLASRYSFLNEYASDQESGVSNESMRV